MNRTWVACSRALTALDGHLSDAHKECLIQDQKTMVETLGSSRWGVEAQAFTEAEPFFDSRHRRAHETHPFDALAKVSSGEHILLWRAGASMSRCLDRLERGTSRQHLSSRNKITYFVAELFSYCCCSSKFPENAKRQGDGQRCKTDEKRRPMKTMKSAFHIVKHKVSSIFIAKRGR